MRRWRVPLDGPDRVPIIRRDVVALSIDIKDYIHIFGQRVLRVHVRVAEARVMGAGMLLVQHRGMVAHPPRLVRAYFHRLLCVFCLFSKCSCAPQPPRAATRQEKSLGGKSTAGFRRKTWRQRGEQFQGSVRVGSARFEHSHVRRGCHRNPSQKKKTNKHKKEK